MRRGSGLAGALLALAKQHGGTFVTEDEAVRLIFPNGSGTATARKRIYQSLYHLGQTGRLRCKRGAFAWPVVLVAKDHDADLAAVSHRPMGRAAVRDNLNRLRLAKNAFDQFFDEVVSEVHRANGSAEASHADPERPVFAMRCADQGEREA